MRTDGGGSSSPEAPARRARHRDWRTYVGGLGRILISLGILILLFVVYQLWGTNIQEARAQSALQDDFDALLASAPAPTTTLPSATTAAPTTLPATTIPVPTSPTLPLPTVPGQTTVAPPPTAPPTTAAPPTTTPGTTLPPALRAPSGTGDPVARIEIPAIGVDKIVVEGVSTAALKKGPGHYPSTPLPGERGNAAIAGHRTTYGAPFSRVDELDPGDEIVVTTVAGRYVYRVTTTAIVAPTDAGVLSPTDDATLTLTSCHPKFSTAQRIVVKATLDPNGSAELREPPRVGITATVPPEPDDSGQTVTSVPAETATTAAPGSGGDDPATTVPAPVTTAAEAGGGSDEVAAGDDVTGDDVTSAAESFADGWFSDPGAWPQVALWGAALSALALASWWFGKKVLHRQWVGVLLAIVPFTVALYFFYENVARLLPPNV